MDREIDWIQAEIIASEADRGNYVPLQDYLLVSRDVLRLWISEGLSGEEMVRRARAHKV